MPRAALVVALVALAAVLFASAPLTVWEFDESLFIRAIDDWNPRVHQPPPPGYPLYIGTARLLAPLFSSRLLTLIGMSIAGSLLALLAFAGAYRRMTRSAVAGVAGAIFFLFSPGMLIHGPLPISDPVALPLLGVSLFLGVRLMERREGHLTRELVLFAAACALTVGFRPQFSIAIVPMFAFLLLWVRPWRSRLLVAAVFGVVCLAWLTPMVASLGGIKPWLEWEANQAAVFARHDAHLSRDPYPPARVAVRFIANPWGPIPLALPFLLVAAAGFVALVRDRERRRLVMPVVFMSAPYLAFALAFMDPADSVRYILPVTAGVAGLAGAGIAALLSRGRASLLVPVVLAGWAAAMLAYAAPVLRIRANHPSPPAAAASWIKENVPPDAQIAYELSLMPQARHLLEGRQVIPFEEAMRRFGSDPAVPLWIYADGSTEQPGAVRFFWPESDAYRKITRNHYRVVSVIPMPASERFEPMEGVYPLERDDQGWAWRWLARRAVLRLPGAEPYAARVTLKLSDEAPFESTRVSLSAGGRPVTVTLLREEPIAVIVHGSGEAPITIEAERSWVPSDYGRVDDREIALRLLRIERLPLSPAPRVEPRRDDARGDEERGHEQPRAGRADGSAANRQEAR